MSIAGNTNDGLSISINEQSWIETLKIYQQVTKKTSEEVIFRQTKNLLWFISRQMPHSKHRKQQMVARFGEYTGKPPQSWIAGMVVSKALVKEALDGGFVIKRQHSAKGVTGRAWMRRGLGKNGKARLKFAGWHRDDRAKYFTKDMAIRKNKAYVNMLKARLGFSQLIPMKALDALKLEASKYGVNIGSTRIEAMNKPDKKKQGEPVYIAVSKTNDVLSIALVSGYTFKHNDTIYGKSQEINAKYYDLAIQRAVPRAITATIKDMQQYIARKTQA